MRLHLRKHWPLHVLHLALHAAFWPIFIIIFAAGGLLAYRLSHGTGLKPTNRQALLLTSPGAPAPDRDTHLDKYVFRILDQDGVGSCTGNALAQIEQIHLATKHMRIPMAAGYLWSQIANSDGDGATTDQIFSAWVRTGQDPLGDASQFSVNDGNRAGDFARKPTPDELTYSAKKYRIKRFEPVRTIAEAEYWIHRWYPLAVAFPVYQGFVGYNEPTGWTISNSGYPSLLGWHMTAEIAYDRKHINPDGTLGAMEFVNSWGFSYGHHGRAWIPYSYLQAADPNGYRPEIERPIWK